MDFLSVVLSGVVSTDIVFKNLLVSGEVEEVAFFAMKSNFEMDDRKIETSTNVLVRGASALSHLKEMKPKNGWRCILRGVFAYPNPKGELCTRVEAPAQIQFEEPEKTSVRLDLFESAAEYFKTMGCTIGGEAKN